jgi:polysaccharide deacetylase family protein (PEP-CTERM system associated)
MLNTLTFDVEDWFMVHNFESAIRFEDWGKQKPRLEKNVDKILKLLDKRKVKATFFVLGWVAKNYPGLVKEISKRGHEIATHGYRHKLVYTQTKKEFETDLRKSISALNKITGKKILGHRAASFSVTKNSLWAIDVLKRNKIKYDASVFPIHHPDYGIPYAPIAPYQLNGLTEFPASVVRIFGVNLPVSGGGYFRVLPYFVTKWAIRKINREGRPAIIYLHPWEFDPGQPRIKVGFVQRFRHYFNLDKTEERLDRLLTDFDFAPVKEVLKL